ncbi:MAG: hypothetical protein ACRDKW_08010, partial [Actinomycetota bacterium]
AHELTHVVQQRSGPVDGTPAAGGISISHPSDSFEQEAEQHAARVMTPPAAEPGPPAAAPAPAAVQRMETELPPVQRQDEGEEEEKEEVQGSFVQRQEEEEQEEEPAPS